MTRDFDLEAQTSIMSGGPSTSSFCTTSPCTPTSPYNDTLCEDRSSNFSTHTSKVASSGEGKRTSRTSKESTQHASEWRPWKPYDPYHTRIPESTLVMEDGVKAMDAFDEGMCKGWRDQIDTLVIFAGLFSATVTAFAVESYQWLDETPADTLARLQLRALLDATHDPAIDHLAPAAFRPSVTSVLINTLWFASLTIALAAVVISILCKQWLYEYQRYDNFTTKESFLIHGLRYRGLQAWRVPEIIASLPILLQTALVLFLMGVLVLLWPIQYVVASIVTFVVLVTFLFLGVTTILPAIQYIYPRFETQCAYKSSQSWSFLLLSTFWLFDFSMFTDWATFDRWEVNSVYNGMGHTLSRVYGLLSNSVDAFQSIYNFLANTSLNPTINADLNLVADFVDGLDASLRDTIIKGISQAADLDEKLEVFQRLEQLKAHRTNMQITHRKLNPIPQPFPPSNSSFHQFKGLDFQANHAYHLRIQETFTQFLGRDAHLANSAIFNRYIEHWARCAVSESDNPEERGKWNVSDDNWESLLLSIHRLNRAHVGWDAATTEYLVSMYSHLLKEDRLSDTGFELLSDVFSGFMECCCQHRCDIPLVALLKNIQDWITRMPDIHLKLKTAKHALLFLVLSDDFFVKLSSAHTSPLETQHLRSFAQFFLNFFEGGNTLGHQWLTQRLLSILRDYLSS